MFTSLDFFAGSGLVRVGLSPEFQTLWANDICVKKQATYVANHGSDEFHLADIRSIRGFDLPAAHLAWASFPCQDLSLAGNLGGMQDGTRSGLFWEWIRVLSEMKGHGTLPPVAVAENVFGFVVGDQGSHFRQACGALRALGFRVGAVVVDANLFVPQSRVRAFIVAVSADVRLDGLCQSQPGGLFHPSGLIRASFDAEDSEWIWWSMPMPNAVRPGFVDLCDRDEPCDSPEKTLEICAMLSPVNRRKLEVAQKLGTFFAGTAYRRTRPDENGTKVQRLEVRFDGVAGCLRSPNGGSSRQTVIIVDRGQVKSRLMTPRECARLMGAPDTYQLLGTYNDCYRAMGDAVAVPVTRWLSRYLLTPLAARAAERGSPRPDITVGDFSRAGLFPYGIGSIEKG